MSIRRPPMPMPPTASIPVPPPPPTVSDADWQALVARHKVASARLDSLIEDEGKKLWWERAYPVDIELPLFGGTVSDGGFPASIGVINIELGSSFYVLGVEASYSITGVLIEDGYPEFPSTPAFDGSPATLTVPETLRPFIMDYTWTIRDSATDRDWCNVPVPSGVLRTGNLGMYGQNAQARVAGGTKITVTVNPLYFNANSVESGLTTISSHSLQFVLTGIEVKDGVL